MSSFFGKLKSGSSATSPTIGSSPSKRDPNAPPPTPLETMLVNAGPIRKDGSDKFFGMENFGNTCYCNSILQSLYYSAPFREHVLSYPKSSSPESLKAAAATAAPRATNQQLANGAPKKPVVTPLNRNANTTSVAPKADDKESPDYKKKQALLAGPILNMNYQNAASHDMPESLFTSLKDVFEAVVANQSRMGVISPIKFLEVLRKENEMFRSAMHQDAHEFLNLLLNAVVENIEEHEKKIEAKQAQEEEHAASNGSADRSMSETVAFPPLLQLPHVGAGSPTKTRWLHELFEGTLTSETRCLTCENISQRDEPFLDLSVDLEQHSSVTSCLNRFSEEEMLCERNKFHCDNCGGLQEAEKRMKIKRLPRILALHLKRFKYSEELQRLQKLFHKVVYPYHLRLFNTTDDAEDPDRLYELYAVVVHIGQGPYHGHYVAIIKTQDRGWLLFDDEMVEPVDKSFVRNFFGDRPGQACAYVLFYQETTVEAVQREQRMEGKRRASQDGHVGLGLRKESAELSRVQSASSPPSLVHSLNFASLNHAVKAPPPLRIDSSAERPSSPLSPQFASPVLPLSPGLSKKEKNKEEKDRKAAEKAAEKERERAEKERERVEKERERIEKQKKKEAESKQISEANKEEPANGKENGHAPGTPPSGFDRFKRNKSLRFGSLGKKDKPEGLKDDTNAQSTDPTPEKKSRFGMRKKSFGHQQ